MKKHHVTLILSRDLNLQNVPILKSDHLLFATTVHSATNNHVLILMSTVCERQTLAHVSISERAPAKNERVLKPPEKWQRAFGTLRL